MEKSKKILSVIIIIVLISLSVILFFGLRKLWFMDKKSENKVISEKIQQDENDLIEDNFDSRPGIPLTDEEKAKQAIVQEKIKKEIETEDVMLGVRGKIVSYSENSIKFLALNNKELELKIPKNGIIFKKRGQDEPIRDYNISKIPVNQEIGVAYMTQSKELIEIKLN